MTAHKQWDWTPAQWAYAIKLFIAVSLWFCLIEPGVLHASARLADMWSDSQAEFEALVLLLFVLLSAASIWALRWAVRHAWTRHEQ